MKEKLSDTSHLAMIEERRAKLIALLVPQELTLEQRIDIEMRLLLERYDNLEQQHIKLLEPGQDNQPSSQTLKRILAEEQSIRIKLEFAGSILSVEQIVISACLSTIAFHYMAPEESSWEHSYPLLQDYFSGRNSLPFSELGYLSKEDVYHLLDMEEQYHGER